MSPVAEFETISTNAPIYGSSPGCQNVVTDVTVQDAINLEQ